MKRGINRRLLVVVVLVAVVVAAAFGALWWRVQRRDPERYLQRAQAARDKGRREEAVRWVRRALQFAESDSQSAAILRVLQEDLLTGQPATAEDAFQRFQELAALRMRLLECDPHDAATARNLLADAYDVARYSGRVHAWHALWQQARQVLDLRGENPTDRWYRGMAGLVDMQRYEISKPERDAIGEDLQAALDHDPTRLDHVYYVALWHVLEAAYADLRSDDMGCKQHVDQALQLVDATASDETSAHAWINRARLRHQLRRLAAFQAEGKGDPADHAANWCTQLDEQIAQILAKTQQLADSAEPDEAIALARMLALTDTAREEGQGPPERRTRGLWRAADVLADARARSPKHRDLLLAHAGIMRQQGRTAQAAEAYEQLLALPAPAGVGLTQLLAWERRLQARLALVDLALSGAEQAQSEAERDRCLAKAGQHAAALQLQGEEQPHTHLALGKVALSRQRPRLASYYLWKAVAVYGERRPQALFYYGVSLARCGETGAAAHALQRVLRQPATPLYQRVKTVEELTEAMLRLRRFDNAIAYAEGLLRTMPDDSRARLLFARTMLGSLQATPQMAAEEWQRRLDALASLAAELKWGEKPQAAALLARLQLLAGEPGKALATCRAGLARASTNPELVAVLARICRRTHDSPAQTLKPLWQDIHSSALPVLAALDDVGTCEPDLWADLAGALGAGQDAERLLRMGGVCARIGKAQLANELRAAAKAAAPEAEAVLARQYLQALSDGDFKAQSELLVRLNRIDPVPGQAVFWQARGQLARGELDAAADALEEVLEEWPAYSDGHVLLGDCLLRAGRQDEALGAFREALRIKPDNVAALERAARLHDRRDEHDKALQAWLGAVVFAPRNGVLLQRCLEALDRHGEPGAAALVRRRLAELAPDDVANQVALGRLLLEQGELEQAGQVLRRANADAPGFLPAAVGLAAWHHASGRTEQACASLDAYVRALGDRTTSQHWLSLARFQTSVGRNEPGLRAYAKAAELERDVPGSDDIQREWARCLKRIGRCSQAAACYARIGDRRGATDWLEQARCLVLGERFAQAEQLLSEFSGTAREQAERALLLARIAERRGEGATVLAFVEQAVALVPDSAPAHYHRARLRRGQGGSVHDGRAVRDLERALELEPQLVEARVLLAQHKAQSGHARVALAELERALRDRPGFLPACELAVELCMTLKRPTALDRLLKQADRLFPDLPVRHRWRAQLAAMRGDQQTALEELKQYHALQRDPEAAAAYAAALLDRSRSAAATAVLAEVPANEDPVCRALFGRAAWQSGNRAVAVEHYAEAVRAAEGMPPRTTAQVAGQILADLDAAAAVDIALATPGEGGELRRRLIRRTHERCLGDPDATQALQAAMDRFPATDPLRSSLQTTLGLHLEAQGHVRQAADAYREAVDADATDVTALNNLADIYTSRLDRPADALPLATAAVAQSTDRPVLHAVCQDTLGATYLNLGRLHEARQALSTSLRSRAMPIAHLHLANAFAALRQFEDARAEAKRGVQLARRQRDSTVQAELEAFLRHGVDTGLWRE